MADARAIAQDPLACEAASQVIRDTADSATREKVKLWLSSVHAWAGYRSLSLLDREGKVCLFTGIPDQETGSVARVAFQEAMASSTPILTDLHVTREVPYAHMDLLIPIKATADSEPAGAVLIRVDPEETLYPLMTSWPVPTTTGEALLVRREGDGILLLSPLRFAGDAVLKLRRPANTPALPAAMAVTGAKGEVEGIDYAGHEVLAFVRAVPDSPWFLIAKEDRSELMAGARRGALGIFLASLFMILAAGGSMAALWRHQQAVSLWMEVEAERERHALVKHFEHFVKYANDIILLADDQGRYVEVSESALHAYGYTREEMLALSLVDTRAPEAQADLPEIMRRLEQEGNTGVRFETMHQRKDGSVFPVEISARFIEVEGKKYFQGIARDITERKRVSEEHQTAIEFLRIVNENLGMRELIQAVTAFIQERSGCEAVGVRLHQGDDYPYYETRGFPAEFVALETSLCARDDDGRIFRDSKGDPRLECMCGNVICGRFNPAQALLHPQREFLEQQHHAPAGHHDGRRPPGEDAEPVQRGRVRVRGPHPASAGRPEDRPAPDERPPARQVHAGEHRALGAARRVSGGGALQASDRGSPARERETPERSAGHGAIGPLGLERGDGRGRMVRGSIQDIRLDPKTFTPQIGSILALSPWPGDHERGQELIRRAMESREKGTYEQRFLLPDGSTGHYVSTFQGKYDDSGNLTSIVGTIQDITERKRAMEALSASEEKYYYMFANNPQVMWIYDLETLAFLEVNSAAVLHYGYTKEEFLSMTLKDIRPQEDIDALMKDVELTRRTYNPAGEWRHLKKNGELMHVEIISHSIKYKDRQARHVMITDITERKRAEEALSASEVRYRRLFEAARDGILILDAETGMVVDVNPFLIDMLGYSREQFLGKKVWELGYLRDIVANQDNFEELQQHQYIRYEDMPLETSDGRLMEVEFVSHVYLVGSLKVIQCNIRDISERKQAERERSWLHGLIESSLNEIYVFDAETLLFKFVNRGACLNIGYSMEELARLTPVDIKPEFTEETFRKAIQPLVAREIERLVFETTHRRKDGSAYPVEVHLQLMPRPGGDRLPRPHQRHHRAQEGGADA